MSHLKWGDKERTCNKKDSPLKELNEMEIGKISDIEFKRMVIRMLKEIIDNYKKWSENSNSMEKEIKITKTKQKKRKIKFRT